MLVGHSVKKGTKFLFFKRYIEPIFSSFKTLIEYRPDAVLGFGGYASFYPVFLASLLGIPTMIHEQNVLSGRANKVLSKIVKRIAVTFKDSFKYFNEKKTVLTGCPANIKNTIDRQKALEYFGLDNNKYTILVVGGSQGSKRINLEFIESVNEIRSKFDIQVIHLSGKEDFDALKEKYATLGVKFFIAKFLYEMEYAYSAADLVVSRAGAATISEVLLFKLPSVLIPYPHAIKNHQKANADILVSRNLAKLIDEKNLRSQVLVENICDMISRQPSFGKYSQLFEELSFSDAADNLAKEIIGLVK
ncbi:MAG: UDP-N-acetylglucosamine--N-acetylmuramyl-(pentapeptide) pyrophosphoryl-undecaprenol N-acetylglucosamine transferase [Candidatus Zapsychrus exili]|nr:UDP-N-acetylglucosamine--N-acetylmuramyl-(pentapeptide) pyrophosphoryl-undecaprenol N-acetylglucosamine transferase [Candidatus Zapsychrus exili]